MTYLGNYHEFRSIYHGCRAKPSQKPDLSATDSGNQFVTLRELIAPARGLRFTAADLSNYHKIRNR